MTTHSGCIWDYPEDVALAYGKVRGIKLALSSLLDDDESAAILEEVGDCVECLRGLIRFFAGLAGSLGVALAEAHGGGEADAIRQFRQLRTEYERDVPE